MFGILSEINAHNCSEYLRKLQQDNLKLTQLLWGERNCFVDFEWILIQIGLKMRFFNLSFIAN